MNILQQLSTSGAAGALSSVVAIGLAFALAQVISGVYVWTFRGMSYSRSFVQGIPLGAIVTSMLLLAIGDSIAAGIGLAGGLSIVRFRTTMRDPRDMVFIFAGLGVGIACGLRAYPTAVAGTALFAVAALALFGISYGARKQFDGVVRFVAPNRRGASDAVTQTLLRHARGFVLIALREASQGEVLEHAYHVSVPDPAVRGRLVADLGAVDGVRDVSLHMQDPSLEL